MFSSVKRYRYVHAPTSPPCGPHTLTPARPSRCSACSARRSAGSIFRSATESLARACHQLCPTCLLPPTPSQHRPVRSQVRRPSRHGKPLRSGSSAGAKARTRMIGADWRSRQRRERARRSRPLPRKARPRKVRRVHGPKGRVSMRSSTSFHRDCWTKRSVITLTLLPSPARSRFGELGRRLPLPGGASFFDPPPHEFEDEVAFALAPDHALTPSRCFNLSAPVIAVRVVSHSLCKASCVTQSSTLRVRRTCNSLARLARLVHRRYLRSRADYVPRILHRYPASSPRAAAEPCRARSGRVRPSAALAPDYAAYSHPETLVQPAWPTALALSSRCAERLGLPVRDAEPH